MAFDPARQWIDASSRTMQRGRPACRSTRSLRPRRQEVQAPSSSPPLSARYCTMSCKREGGTTPNKHPIQARRWLGLEITLQPMCVGGVWIESKQRTNGCRINRSRMSQRAALLHNVPSWNDSPPCLLSLLFLVLTSVRILHIHICFATYTQPRDMASISSISAYSHHRRSSHRPPLPPPFLPSACCPASSPPPPSC